METVDPLWRPLTGASRKKKKKEVYDVIYQPKVKYKVSQNEQVGVFITQWSGCRRQHRLPNQVTW